MVDAGATCTAGPESTPRSYPSVEKAAPLQAQRERRAASTIVFVMAEA